MTGHRVGLIALLAPAAGPEPAQEMIFARVGDDPGTTEGIALTEVQYLALPKGIPL